VALTLRAVGGLTAREIADAFYVSEATMAQWISRAKRTLRGRRLDQPGDLAIVVADLAAAAAFSVEVGLKLQGEGPRPVEGGWVDRVVGLEGVRGGDRDGADPGRLDDIEAVV